MIATNLPTISIVTCSFNQGRYLEATINSILSQKYPKLEYIIIDGGSTDQSVEIIKKYRQYLAYWVSEHDSGQADALNKGFQRTSGKIMSWLNSDDVLMPGSLFLVGQLFAQLKQVDWISGIPTTINEQGFLMHQSLRPAYVRSLVRRGWYHGARLGFVMQEGTFWRRSLWEITGGRIDDVYYSMDYKLWRRFAEHSELTPVYTSLATYRLNPNRKNASTTGYYQEINVKYPMIQRFLFMPLRILFHLIMARFRFSSKIYFNHTNGSWMYAPGILGKRISNLSKKKLHIKL